MRIHPLQLGCGDAQICVVGEIKPLNARGSYLNEPLSLYVIIEGSVVVPGIGLGKERETCHRTSVPHFLYNLDTTTTTTQISWHFIRAYWAWAQPMPRVWSIPTAICLLAPKLIHVILAYIRVKFGYCFFKNHSCIIFPIWWCALDRPRNSVLFYSRLGACYLP